VLTGAKLESKMRVMSNRRPPGTILQGQATVNQFRWTILQDPKQQRTLNTRRLGRALAAYAKDNHIALSRHPANGDYCYPQRVWDAVLGHDGHRYFDEEVEVPAEVEQRVTRLESELTALRAQIEVLALALRGVQ
jgi:hypothetical protein